MVRPPVARIMLFQSGRGCFPAPFHVNFDAGLIVAVTSASEFGPQICVCVCVCVWGYTAHIPETRDNTLFSISD